jgi:hypothetical protein
MRAGISKSMGRERPRASKLARYSRTGWRWLFLVYFAWAPVQAQDVHFLPEVDAHVKLNSTFRAYVEAKDDRDGGEPDQFAIGPSLQFYLKPLIKLKKVKTFDLDDSKERFLVLETGCLTSAEMEVS